MQVCLPKHNSKLDNNLLSPGLWIRIVLMRIRIQLKFLMRIRIQIRIRWGGGGVGPPKMCIPPGKILGTPLPTSISILVLSDAIAVEYFNKTATGYFLMHAHRMTYFIRQNLCICKKFSAVVFEVFPL